MEDFIVKADFPEINGIYQNYKTLMTVAENECRIIREACRKLNMFVGFGIENEVIKLRRYAHRLEEYKEHIEEEWNTLKSIGALVKECENKAAGILGAEQDNSAAKEYTFSEDGIWVTHDDWAKLMKQFKHYSQNNSRTKEFYENILKKFYDLNQDTWLPEDFYEDLKNLFYTLMHKDDGDAFVYHNVEFLKGDSDFDKTAYSGKANADASLFSYEAAYGFDGDTVEYTLKIGSVDLEGFAGLKGLSLSEDQVKDLSGALMNTKTNEEAKAVLLEFGIEIKGEVQGITVDVVKTKKLSDEVSFYNKTTFTLGDAYAEASILHGELNTNSTGDFSLLDVGAGASIAKVESSLGFITNDGTYAIKGGLDAGIEWALKLGSESEIKMALASIGFDIKNGFDFYKFK